jgi:hypothetical protein
LGRDDTDDVEGGSSPTVAIALELLPPRPRISGENQPDLVYSASESKKRSIQCRPDRTTNRECIFSEVGEKRVDDGDDGDDDEKIRNDERCLR